MSTPIWEQLITQHFSDPVYHGDNMTLVAQLEETLYSAEHGLQHNDCHARWDTSVQPMELVLERHLMFYNVTINGVFYPEWDGFRISVDDLQKHLGVAPNPGQSAKNFMEDHFSMY